MKLRQLSNNALQRKWSDMLDAKTAYTHHGDTRAMLREMVKRSKAGRTGCSICQNKSIASYERDGWPVCHKCRKVRQSNGLY